MKEGERADFESGARLSGENPTRAEYVVARSRCSAALWSSGLLNLGWRDGRDRSIGAQKCIHSVVIAYFDIVGDSTWSSFGL